MERYCKINCKAFMTCAPSPPFPSIQQQDQSNGSRPFSIVGEFAIELCASIKVLFLLWLLVLIKRKIQTIRENRRQSNQRLENPSGQMNQQSSQPYR